MVLALNATEATVLCVRNIFLATFCCLMLLWRSCKRFCVKIRQNKNSPIFEINIRNSDQLLSERSRSLTRNQVRETVRMFNSYSAIVLSQKIWHKVQPRSWSRFFFRYLSDAFRSKENQIKAAPTHRPVDRHQRTNNARPFPSHVQDSQFHSLE